MKKKLFLMVSVLIIIATGVGYFWWQQENLPAADTSLTLYGNVDIREVRLAFDGSGHIETILVQEGDKVRQGQRLARLKTAHAYRHP